MAEGTQESKGERRFGDAFRKQGNGRPVVPQLTRAERLAERNARKELMSKGDDQELEIGKGVEGEMEKGQESGDADCGRESGGGEETTGAADPGEAGCAMYVNFQGEAEGCEV
jgi:hypothetical protein